MELRKIATITVNVFAGFIVVLVGLTLLSFPFSLVWGTFNVWLWIVSPTAILWAKKKEDEKNSISSKMKQTLQLRKFSSTCRARLGVYSLWLPFTHNCPFLSFLGRTLSHLHVFSFDLYSFSRLLF